MPNRLKVSTRLRAHQPPFPHSTDEYVLSRSGVCENVCLLFESQEEISMARRVGQIIACGDQR